MIDFPITDVLDDAASTQWLEQHLHPNGLHCPHCGSANRWFFRQQEHFVAYRCRDCAGYYTLLTGTAFEANELHQNAGKKSARHADPTDPPRRRANKQRGHGTFANDRPPIFSVVRRDTGAIRYVVCDQATKETCRTIVVTYVPPTGTVFYTDEWLGYRDVHPVHGTVCHSTREWTRDDNGDGHREVHCNTCTCEGWGTTLRTFLWSFRGVHKAYLACYVTVFEAIANAKRITPEVVRRMCFGKALCT